MKRPHPSAHPFPKPDRCPRCRRGIVLESTYGWWCSRRYGPDGASAARFSIRSGRDVHRSVAEQRATGKECLDCAPDTNYDAFVASVQRHYGVVIPAKHRPRPSN